MSSTEFGEIRSRQSKAEWEKKVKKEYYKAFTPFVVFTLVFMVSAIGFMMTDQLILRLSIMFSTVFCMLISLCWANLIIAYNKTIDELVKGKGDTNITYSPRSTFCFISTMVMPIVCFLMMIPVTLKVIMEMPDLRVVSCLDAIFFFACTIVNVLGYTKIRKEK